MEVPYRSCHGTFLVVWVFLGYYITLVIRISPDCHESSLVIMELPWLLGYSMVVGCHGIISCHGTFLVVEVFLGCWDLPWLSWNFLACWNLPILSLNILGCNWSSLNIGVFPGFHGMSLVIRAFPGCQGPSLVVMGLLKSSVVVRYFHG